MDNPSPNNIEQTENHETTEEPPTKKRAVEVEPPTKKQAAQEETPTNQPEPAITITVRSQDGSKLFFRIKRDTQLFKLLLAFCERKQVDYRSMRFLYDGKYVNGNHTPNRLRMEDGDEIDAMRDQVGGGCEGC